MNVRRNKRFQILFILLAMLICLAVACGDDDDDNDNNDDVSPVDDDTSDDDTAPVDDDDNDDDTVPDYDPLDYVNVFIGTSGKGWGVGAMVPGPTLPHASVKLSPDTTLNYFRHPRWNCGGYFYDDNMIRGFSHTHLPGTGIPDLANINLMPVDGMDGTKTNMYGYSSHFSHETEAARPGYYTVRLDDWRVQVELTTSWQSGFHRYTFDESTDPYVIIDVSYAIRPFSCRRAEVTVDPEAREVYGYTDQRGSFSRWTGGLPTYFVARFSQPFADHGVFADNTLDPGGTHTTGRAIGAYLGFGEQRNVEAKVGISFISVEQARRNLDEQIGGLTFDETRETAEDIWREQLSDVLVEGDDTRREIFTTAMYHLYMLPTSFTEQGGFYRGFDREVHTAGDFTYYTDFSLWDTFRSFHPLMVLLRPETARDFVISLTKMYEQGGAFPRWAQGLGDSQVMIGTHADSVVADAYIKGITDFDIATAYQGLREHAVQEVPYGGRNGLEWWLDLGYLPYNRIDQSVSRTVEFAYDDWCLAQLAEKLGREQDHAMFAERAGNYALLWDDETKMFRPKNHRGDWLEAFYESWTQYPSFTEGNPRQWRWFAPHDVPGLIELMGGTEPFLAELDEFFANSVDQPEWVFPDLWYWHGNEPDIHAPYLFAMAGRPDKTAEWTRWIMDTLYTTAVDGLDGNDDGGTLSAWYVFSALGFYPVAPGSEWYIIGTPLFECAVAQVGGQPLTITAPNVSPENIYVQSVRLNGEQLDEPWFRHSDIAGGGTLEFTMGATPSDWGQGIEFNR